MLHALQAVPAKSHGHGCPSGRAPAGSRLAIHVVPTDEELMIARHTVALLSARGGR